MSYTLGDAVCLGFEVRRLRSRLYVNASLRIRKTRKDRVIDTCLAPVLIDLLNSLDRRSISRNLIHSLDHEK